MYAEFFEQVDRVGLQHAGTTSVESSPHISTTRLLDLASEFAEITSAEHFSREHSIFAQSASLPLGGGRFPCSGINCRTRRAYQLAQYAAMYADKVYIKNFLADHFRHRPRNSESNPEFRRALLDDFEVLQLLRPLIERGVIVPFTTRGYYCPFCLPETSLGAHLDKRLQEQAVGLLDRFHTELSAELRLERGKYYVRVEGPDDLLEHGTRDFRVSALPPEIMAHPELVERLRLTGVLPISQDTWSKLKAPQELTWEAFQSIVFELITANSLGTTFLTEAPLQIDVLTSLSQDVAIEKRNHLAYNHLTSLVPFLSGVSIPDVIKLRQKEEEAFILYRRSLNQAIAEYIERGAQLNERDARALYSEYLEPRLAELTRTVKAARRGLFRSTRAKITGYVGAISFGTYTGLLPSSLLAAAKAVGFTKIISELLESASLQSTYDETIRTDDLYFLWKVRELGAKSIVHK